MPKIEDFEIEELAASICKTKSEERDVIERKLYEKYEVTLEQYADIVNDLFARIGIGVSPLTNTPMIGFSEIQGKLSMWLIKKEITNEYISSVIQWASEGTKIPKDGGFEKEITSNGKVEYVITICGPEYKNKKKANA